MTVHNIVSGDTLWGIVKKNYNLTNNTDIANMVNKVAKVNGISNPDKIYAGKTIQLVDVQEKNEDTFVRTTNDESTSQGGAVKNVSNPMSSKDDKTQVTAKEENNNNTEVSPTVQKAIDEKLASKDLKSYEDINKAENTTVNLFAQNATDEEKEKAYTDFSNGILKSYNADGDGTVTVEEFAQKEYADNIKASELTVDAFGGEVSEQNKLASQRLGNIFAQNLDINQNGKIDTEEMNFFNKTADAMDGQQDGQISTAYEKVLFSSIIGTNVDNKELQAVTEKYFEGIQLTDEEQKIFDEGMKTINKSMRDMSGID